MKEPRRRPDGHANIEEHPIGSGRYRVRARVDGELKIVVSGVSQAEANDIAAGYAEIRNESVFKEGLPMKEFGPQYMNYREGQGIRGIRQDRSRWDKHVTKDVIAKLAVSSITKLDILDWMDRRKKISYRSKLKLLNLMRTALAYAVERGYMDNNPAATIKLNKAAAATEKDDLEGILTPDEQRALIGCVPEREQAAIVFALSTGMRQAEQWWLKWTDIVGNKIVVKRSSNGKPPKSGKPRDVYLLPAAEAALKVMKAERALRREPSEFVFVSLRGKRRQEGKAPPQWEKWLERAGIKRHVRWHDLRHTCATSLLAGWWGRKWSLDEVCTLLGHSSVTVTERYARKLSDTLRLAVAETQGFSEEVPKMFPVTTSKSLSRLSDLNRRPVLYESTQKQDKTSKKKTKQGVKVPPRELQASKSIQDAIAETPDAPLPLLPPSSGTP